MFPDLELHMVVPDGRGYRISNRILQLQDRLETHNSKRISGRLSGHLDADGYLGYHNQVFVI